MWQTGYFTKLCIMSDTSLTLSWIACILDPILNKCGQKTSVQPAVRPRTAVYWWHSPWKWKHVIQYITIKALNFLLRSSSIEVIFEWKCILFVLSISHGPRYWKKFRPRREKNHNFLHNAPIFKRNVILFLPNINLNMTNSFILFKMFWGDLGAQNAPKKSDPFHEIYMY